MAIFSAKKLLCALLVALVSGALATPAFAATDGASSSNTAQANAANLVLVARFADDATGDGSTGYNAPDSVLDCKTKWECLQRTFNDTAALNDTKTTTYSRSSFRGYLLTVSQGQHNVVSVFPQTATDDSMRVSYITLPHALDYYYESSSLSQAGDSSLLADLAAEFNTGFPQFDMSAVNLDGDKSSIDNVMVILEATDATIASHEGNAASFGVSLNGLMVGNYEILPSDRVGTRFSNGVTSVPAHEYLHAQGARDLYRANAAGEYPAAGWDIMASAYPSLLPTAQTRQDCGWTNIAVKREGGRFTLNSLASGGQQAVAFKTSANATEYFVAEYRQKGMTTAAGSYDNYIGLDASATNGGVIVYRVNPAYGPYPGDASGNQQTGLNYLYVFRPGETNDKAAAARDAGDCAGEWSRAALSASGVATLGSLDYARGVADGAITYSDGTNSGIVISVVEQDDAAGYATITVEMADAPQGQWETVLSADDSTPFSSKGSVSSQIIAGEGGVYALSQTSLGGAFVVDFYNGETWSSLGTVANAGNTAFLASHAGGLYCVVENNGRATVYQRQAATWASVATASCSGYHVSLASVGGSLYLATSDSVGEGFSATESLAVYQVNVAAGSATQVGGSLSAQYLGTHPTLFELNGAVALAYGDYFGSATKVYVLNGESWTSAYRTQGSYSTSAALVSGTTYMLLSSSEGNRLVSFGKDGASQEVPVEFAGQFEANTLFTDGAALYAVTTDLTDSSANVYCVLPDASGATVNRVGEAAGKPANYASATYWNGNLYCMLNGGGNPGTVQVVRRAVESGPHDCLAQGHRWNGGTCCLCATLRGDANLNGALNIVDAQVAYDIGAKGTYQDNPNYQAMRASADAAQTDATIYVDAIDAWAIQRAVHAGWTAQ